MINFPASPVENQAFNGYAYRSGQWKRVAYTALPKNYVVNPAMQISQQNANTGSSVTGYFPADQWNTVTSGVGLLTAIRVQSTTPKGATDRIRFTVSTIDATMDAGDIYVIYTPLEGTRVFDLQWGTPQAVPVVVRFGWKSPAGTYSFSLRNSAAVKSYTLNFTVSAGQANTDTEQIFSIPGPVDGAWVNDSSGPGIQFYVTLGTGTSRQGAAGVWNAANTLGTTSNTNGVATLNSVYEIFDVGLYADPYSTGVPPPFEIPEYSRELRRCQRYWYRSIGLSGASSSATTTSRVSSKHPAPLRIAPIAANFAVVGSPAIFNGDTSWVIASVSSSASTVLFAEGNFTVTAGALTAGRRAIHYYNADTNYIAVSVRM